MNTNRILSVVLFAIFCACSFQVLAANEVNGVTVKDNEVYAMQGDKLELLTNNIELPFDVTVSTNGNFKVGEDGKERKIEEGQVVRNDGWLLNPDGSIQPVFDHVGMKNGQVYVVRDGQAKAITASMVFPNGMSIGADGFGANLPGGRLRMLDGQLFRLDGTPIQAKDTVTLKNGRVVVQKDGTLIPLLPVQMMGMSDGTRVHGNGAIEKHDGTTFQISEGQTILLDGANYGH